MATTQPDSIAVGFEVEAQVGRRLKLKAPQAGITVEAHAKLMMADVETSISSAFEMMRGRRLRPAEREAASRLLAGVIGQCESLRLWLAAGAPR